MTALKSVCICSWLAAATVVLALPPAGRAVFVPAPASPFSVGGVAPVSVAVGDLNGDGDLDLVTANEESSQAAVLLGDGAGGFSPAAGSPFSIPNSAPASVAIGDLNGDGAQDVATANAFSSNVSVLLGNGSGGLSSAPGSPFAIAANSPVSIAIGDFNGDGDFDLVTANSLSQNVSVLLGDGSGGFTPASGSPFPVGGVSPLSVAVGDLDGAGGLDLVTAGGASGDITVLLGNGSGGFSLAPGSPFMIPGPVTPVSVAVGDLGFNPPQDIVLAELNQNAVDVLVPLGSGRHGTYFSPFPVGGVHPASVAIGDLDGDGQLDFVTANGGSDDVSVLVQRPAASFWAFPPAAGSPFPVGGNNPVSVVVGDLDGDGDLDLATANAQSNNVSVVLNEFPIVTLTPTSHDSATSRLGSWKRRSSWSRTPAPPISS